jgi:hypothetical protein
MCLVMSLLRKRDDVLSHSYDFAYGKSYDMIARLTSNCPQDIITKHSFS